MSLFFLWVALGIALLDWIAVARGWKPFEYILKPGVMVALLAWLWQAGGTSGHVVWFGVGLLFSLAGDVFLMLPRERFIAGLVSFLLAHVAYITGLNASPPPANVASLALAVIVGITSVQVFRRIKEGLQRSGYKSLTIPVMVYGAVVSLMLLSALLSLLRDDWLPGPALLMSVGALLFLVSDVFLAWNKFVAPLSWGKLRVIVTYHVGQVMIVSGAMLHFLQS